MAVALLSWSHCASATVYQISLFFDYPPTVPGGLYGSVGGTITTDGTIGVISTSNIVDFSLNPFNGTASFGMAPAIDGGTTIVDILGGALVATSTGLYFNFGFAVDAYVKFQDTQNPANLFCLEAVGSSCSSIRYDISVSTTQGVLIGDSFAKIYPFPFAPSLDMQVGQVSISGVPEPSTWIMLLFGFVGIFAASCLQPHRIWRPTQGQSLIPAMQIDGAF